MMNNITTERIQNLIADQTFAEQLHAAAGNNQELFKVFKDFELTNSYEEFLSDLAEIKRIADEQVMISENGEVTEEMLEVVSGGRSYPRSMAAFAKSGFYAARGDALRSLGWYAVGVANLIF